MVTESGIHSGPSRYPPALASILELPESPVSPVPMHLTSAHAPAPGSYLEIRDGRREGPAEKETMPLPHVPTLFKLCHLLFQTQNQIRDTQVTGTLQYLALGPETRSSVCDLATWGAWGLTMAMPLKTCSCHLPKAVFSPRSMYCPCCSHADLISTTPATMPPKSLVFSFVLFLF